MTPDPNALDQRLFAELRALEGRYWREVHGEVQEPYGECAIWVLLYEDSDPAESHRAFCDVVAPYVEAMKPLELTVGYSVLTQTVDISVETLMSSAEILAARNDPAFARHRSPQGRRAHTGFKADVSGLRPA